MIQLVIHGGKGRMGSRLCALAVDDSRFTLVAAVDVDSPPPGDLSRVDVVIDFSSESGTSQAVKLARQWSAALLVGTTGLSAQTLVALDDASHSVPVLLAANTSLGVAVMTHLAAEAARLLGTEYDIDIVETHHAMKKDAPSGTALRIARALRDGAGVILPAERIHAMRSGDVIGEHEVIFSGLGERIKFSHSATNRDLFVLGALRAAAWLAGQQPGLYTINQALGLDNG